MVFCLVKPHSSFIRQSYPTAQMTLLHHLPLCRLHSLDFLAQAPLSVCSLIYFITSLAIYSRHFYYFSSSPRLLLCYPTTLLNPPNISTLTMCYVVVEKYSVCRCLYYKHSVDMCSAYGQKGHPVQERTVLVGYACERHSSYQQQQASDSRDGYSDSGYGTASHSSHTHSSRRHRR